MRPIPWGAIREEFENSSTPGTELAKKYGINPTSIGYQVKKHHWKRPDDYSFKGVSHQTMAERAKLKPAIPALEVAEGGQLTPVVGATHLTSVPISEDIDALAALRDRIIGQHKVSISRDMAYLDLLEKGIMEKKSAPLQKLNALQTIVKIRYQLVELERQAHSIVQGVGEKQQTNIQVNVNVSPQDAYRSMIEGK